MSNNNQSGMFGNNNSNLNNNMLGIQAHQMNNDIFDFKSELMVETLMYCAFRPDADIASGLIHESFEAMLSLTQHRFPCVMLYNTINNFLMLIKDVPMKLGNFNDPERRNAIFDGI